MDSHSNLRLFVSHHSSKLPVAEHVERALAPKGVGCWIAPRDIDPGEPFDRAVRQAIAESSAILLLFCSKSERSRHVKRELILADQVGKAIIPLRLERIDPGELSYHLADSQWIDWIEQRDAVIDRIAAKAREFHERGDSDRPGAATAAVTGPTGGLIEPFSSPPVPLSPPPPPGRPGAALWAAGIGGALLVALVAIFLVLRGGESATDGGSVTADNSAAPAALAAPSRADVAARRPPPSPAPQGSPPRLSWPDPSAPPAGDVAAAPRVRPSFDCARAGSRVELMICDSAELAELDNRMAALYRQAAASGVDRAALNRAQRRWLDLVRNQCADADCIADAYRLQLSELRATID